MSLEDKAFKIWMSPDKFELVIRIEDVEQVISEWEAVNDMLRNRIAEAKKILENLNKNGVWATPARVNTLGREALMALALDFEKTVDCLREALK